MPYHYKRRKKQLYRPMKEPYVLMLSNGGIGLIEASCLAEAKSKAFKIKSKILKSFPVEDFRLMKAVKNK